MLLVLKVEKGQLFGAGRMRISVREILNSGVMGRLNFEEP